jgi:uncharacterized membrane protein
MNQKVIDLLHFRYNRMKDMNHISVVKVVNTKRSLWIVRYLKSVLSRK